MVNARTNLQNANATITNAQNNLGITDLNNLPNLNGKTLLELVNHKYPTPPSHTCSPCALPHLTIPHVCPIVNNVNCSHTDYEELKRQLAEEQDKLKKQKENWKKEIEARIISQIITQCQLDLSPKSNFEQLINKLKELLKTPDQVEQTAVDSNLMELEKRLKAKELIIKELNTKNADLSNNHNRSREINILLAIILIVSWLVLIGLVGLAVRNARKRKSQLK